MAGILGIFRDDGDLPGSAALRRMQGGLERRGANLLDVWREGPALLAVCASAWEAEEDPGSGTVCRDGDLVAVADASIFYRTDLLRRLERAGVRPAGEGAGHLVLAAYRAWGAACAEWLEGDWAFIVWDRSARLALGSRGFGGKRPLFFATPPGAMIVASTIGSVLAHPACSAEVELASVAAEAAGLIAASGGTGYRGVHSVPAGSGLLRHDARVRAVPGWRPPDVRADDRTGFDEAADELRLLLRAATAERLARSGPTATWLSGGWDSTAVHAAGGLALRDRPAAPTLRAVSISYPPDDPGHEDPWIRAAAAHWGGEVHWIPSGGVPLLDESLAWIQQREQPYAHAFEGMNRALAAGTRAVGARVALDGVGGDQCFQVSNIYLADLLRTGRLPELLREWRSKRPLGMTGRFLLGWALDPLLPPALLRARAALLRRPPPRPYLERVVAPWFRDAFFREHRLLEREAEGTPPRTGPDRAAYEMRWYLLYPHFERVFALQAGFALDAGVHLRSPLFDRRVVEFAVRRPRADRAQGAETKRLLRHAMRGLLPDTILAPRTTRTGVAGGYLQGALRERHAAFVDALLRRAPLRLADAGIVDASTLLRFWDEFRSGRRSGIASHLFLTIQAELWLRARG